MKKLIASILFPFLIIPFGTKANENFSVEIEALTLVMEQYKENAESSSEPNTELEIDIKKFIQLMPLSLADNPRYKKNKHIL